MLQYVVRGIKRSPVHAARQPCLPITLAILRLLKSAWTPLAVTDADYIMLWVACCRGFFGFMRAGEFTAAAPNEFDSSSTLCSTDTAPMPHPCYVCFYSRARQTLSAKVSPYSWAGHMETCAQFLLCWHLCPDIPQLLVHCLCSRMGRSSLASSWSDVKQALTATGLDVKGYSGHSFRIGAATTAAAKGVEDSVIKMLGRWESLAYQNYLRTPRDTLAAISARQNSHV